LRSNVLLFVILGKGGRSRLFCQLLGVARIGVPPGVPLQMMMNYIDPTYDAGYICWDHADWLRRYLRSGPSALHNYSC